MKLSIYVAAGLLLFSSAAVPTLTNSTVYANTDGQSQLKQIEIPIDTVKTGSEGSRTVLVTKSVENGEYEVVVTARNQSSVHPNSNLYVKSGSSEVRVADVEREAHLEKKGEGSLVVANGNVVVELEFGAHKIFSGGLVVVLTPVAQPPVEEPKEEDKPQVESVKDEPSQPEAPKKLPETGVASLVSGTVGIGSLVYATQMYRISARRLNK